MGQLEQFLSDIAPNGDWQPLIDYINQNYVSKDKIKELIKEIQKTMCPMCCECGLCEEFEKILEENNNE